MELVSVVIPIYNMCDKIDVCVKSLLRQTYKNIEILLVDDGSKDNSLKHCKKWKEIDDRVRVFHTSNQGSGLARNYGIINAKGRYIFFPDADDYIDKKAIQILVEAMGEDIDLVVFGYKSVSVNGKVKSVKKYPEQEKNANLIRAKYSDYMTKYSKLDIQGAPWNKFFDLDLIKRNNILFPALRRHQDEGFIARYMCYTNKVHFIPDVLYTYYTNDLKKEWDKYPLDYMNVVSGLYDERKNNILIWNPEDKYTHDLVYKEYICNYIKALELSFSPKYKFNSRKRKEWIKAKRNEMQEVIIPNCTDIYHKIAFILAKKRSWFLYYLLGIKVMLEKMGLKEILNR